MQMKNVEDVYPLSPMQEGMLFHSVYTTQSEMYFEQVTCILRGKLHVSAFKQAWQQVVARHPILRTCFLWERLEEHLQVVRQRVELPWSEHNWTHLPSHEQETRVQAWQRADRAQGFDLARAPLLRFSLIRLSEHTHHFIWSFHHLLLDGWSTSMVLGEVFTCYEAIAQNRDFSLPASRPYRDYIAWLQQQDLSLAKAFWSRTLQGFTVPTPLGVDRAPDQEGETASAYHSYLFRIPAVTIDGLQRLARQHQMTLNTLAQGAWAILLACYSGQDDVVFGVTVSGRPAALTGVETMVGLFINTLPVRARLARELRLIPWLQQLQAQQAEARQYEYSPLVQVQNWSEVPRGQHLFESLFVFENYPVDASLRRESSLEVEATMIREWTNYPLTVTLIPEADLLVRISYMGSRLKADAIQRMAQHFQTILENMLAQPEQQLSTLSLLTARERQQLLVDWNETVSYQQDRTLHILFEEQVERTPESIALVFEEQQLTYHELNQRANQLACSLQQLGVGPEICVGLCFERSLELIIGLLGILKAGGAYVPLDPDYPMERLTFILQDAQIAVLVSMQPLLERLPAVSMPLLCLDRDWPTIASASSSYVPVSLHADQLAYVIYTSGSTGTPKGVLVSHWHVARLFACTQPQFRFDQHDHWTLFHSIAFDFSVWELWGALLYGGRLTVVPFWQSREPASFFDLLTSQQISVLNLTPSAFRQLVTIVAAASMKTALALRLVIFGGEALDLNSVCSWWNHVDERCPQLVNMYGITETTVHVTWLTLSPQVSASGPSSPIGRPLPDLQVYVLDRRGQPVPVGVVGELYVGGAGVARGYLGRPELTAQRFVPHPWSRQPGARLYRSGDLARYTEEGQLEYLGRNDAQVKLRGFRIELGEIEAALQLHPSVREAVVMLREDSPGDVRLVAYVVTNQEQATTSSELRHHLRQRLPDYMLPASLVLLEAMPLTSNGKVDREALPQPDQIQAGHKSMYIAPRTHMEEELVSIWAQVLRRERIGIYDHFLELGGSSLLATQIIARIRHTFQVDLSLRNLLQAATIASLAEQVEVARRDSQTTRIPSIKRLTRSSL